MGNRTVALEWINRMLGIPNFNTLILEQCHNSKQVAMQLEAYIQTGGDTRHSLQIMELEQEWFRMRDRNLDILKRAFASPEDRAEINRACTASDSILQFAIHIVRELNLVNTRPDLALLQMAAALRQNVENLEKEYIKAAASPEKTENNALYDLCREVEYSLKDAMSWMLDSKVAKYTNSRA